jgi:arylsulfatase A-like enzyme
VGSFRIAVLLCFAGAGYLKAQAAPIILISVDTLRADHLSSYGYRRIRTPNIDAYAVNGTAFTAISSHIPLTLPSHTSIFTSTYPFVTRVEENAERVPAGLVTLASVLRSHGYKTAAFIGSSLLDQRYGLDQGFDFYDSPFHLSSNAAENPYDVRVRRDAALVVRSAEQWLTANHGQPVFAFVHLFDLHTPYSRPAPARGRPAVAGYDAELEYVDQVLGRFREALVKQGLWDRSLVVLLADHGESLEEHGESSHGYFIYASTVWVPLLMHWPAGQNAGRPARVTEPGGLIDVAPTILSAASIPAPPSFQGRNLMAGDQAAGHPVYAESLYTYDAFRWAPLRSLREGDYKYIEAPRPELYNLRDDPHEQINLVRKNTAKAQELRVRLGKLLARYASQQTAPVRDTSPESTAALRSLGYLSGGAPSFTGESGPDPKDRLPEYQLYEKALAALYSEQPETAILNFRKLLAADSKNTLARYYLGEAYLKTRQPDTALREWESALSADPADAPAAEAIGEVWMERQEFAKAQHYFELALTADANDYAAEFKLGVAEERLGKWDNAVRHLQAACKLVPQSSECERELTGAERKLK